MRKMTVGKEKKKEMIRNPILFLKINNFFRCVYLVFFLKAMCWVEAVLAPILRLF